MIQLSPLPQAELALPLVSSSFAVDERGVPIDDADPLILPSLRPRINPGFGMAPGPEDAPPPLSRDLRTAAAGSPVPPLLRAGDRIGAGEPAPPPPSDPEDPEPAAGQSPASHDLYAAIEPVIAERRRQLEEFGHTTEQDLGLRPNVLPDRAIRYLVSVQEDLQFRRGDFVANARRHAAQAGAMALAIIDWLDAGGGR